MKGIINELIFWMAWIIIPILMEIIPSFLGSLLLVKKRIFYKKYNEPIKFPQINIIVPVYNSSETIERCLRSIYESDYPIENISVLLVNNGIKDESFDIFGRCQHEFKELSMQWINSKQGKSKALNMAIFNSNGKYIINIDSDGVLHKSAIKNTVIRFEENQDVDCLTGAIIVDSNLIKNTKKIFLKIIRKCEMLEYAQAFLAGRNFQSEINSIYTLSGAFSAFRKSVLLKTQLYNTDTICEDTQVTFQIRHLLGKKVNLCENAFFLVDPIEDFNKLYTQRQRWQRGEMEVSHMFLVDKLNPFSGLFKNFMVRVLMFDHTFAFPRMIWYFALICLGFMNYSLRTMVISVLILYLLYTVAGFVNYINILTFLKGYKDIRREYVKKTYILILMPLYNFIVFWIRLAGIINSITTDSSWRVETLSDEMNKIKQNIISDFNFLIKLMGKIKKFLNKR